MIQTMKFNIQSKNITFDNKLIGHILELSQTLPSNQHTNIGGWQHDFIVNGRPSPDWLNPIVSQIDKQIQRYQSDEQAKTYGRGWTNRAESLRPK